MRFFSANFLILFTIAACNSQTGSDRTAAEYPMPSNPSPVFTHHLTDLTHISTIHPMGAAWEGLITDNGHTYHQINPQPGG